MRLVSLMLIHCEILQLGMNFFLDRAKMTLTYVKSYISPIFCCYTMSSERISLSIVLSTFF
jgi:hypothetical protein